MNYEQTVTETVTVTIRNGLHAVPCYHITEIVKDYQGTAHLSNGRSVADCRSVLELMLLNGKEGTELCLTVTGEEAELLVEKIKDFFVAEGKSYDQVR